MKLASMLFKAGIATAGTGIYLFFRRVLKKVKKTTNDTAEKLETNIVKAKKKAKAKTKTVAKPRQKKVQVRPVMMQP
jgi:hypothetical protein